MNAGIKWISEHKAIAASVAVIVFIGAYLLAKSKGSGSGGAVSSTGLTPADASFLQTQAGLQAAAAGNATAVDIAQIQSNTQIAAINASQNIANTQTAAQVEATTAGYTTAEDLANIQSSTVQNLATTQSATELGIAGIQGQTYQTAIQANQTLAENQQALAQNAIDLIQSGQFNKGGSGGVNQIAALGVAFGQPAVGVAGVQQAGNVAVSGNNLAASVTKSLAGLASGFFGV